MCDDARVVGVWLIFHKGIGAHDGDFSPEDALDGISLTGFVAGERHFECAVGTADLLRRH